MKTSQALAGVAALFAAVLTTTVVIGSQLTLADWYSQGADRVMASKQPQLARAASAAPSGRRAG